MVWRWAGKYRQSDKNIGEPWPDIPTKVQTLCEDVAYWIEHQRYGWDEIGARFHHRLVSVRPFANGNGRHARLMADVLMLNNDQPLFTWGRERLDLPGQARQAYIAALRAADTRDWKPLIDFVRA